MFEKILDKLQGRVALADGGALIAKRGLVDGPGGYAGREGLEKYVYEKRPGEFEIKGNIGGKKIYKGGIRSAKEANRISKDFQKQTRDIVPLTKQRYKKIDPVKLKMLNRYSQHFFNKDYKDLTYEQRNDTVNNYYRRSPKVFNVKSERDLPTPAQQKLIKDAFPDTNFKFTKGQKLGVPITIKGKRNPEYSAVANFIQRGYKKTLKDLLPLSVQKQIIAKFDLPKGVKEWDFENYKYGIPNTRTTNMNLGKRIITFINDPKSFKISADFGTPKGWMMGQMERAFRDGNQNYIPTYKTINGKKIIVGFTDNSEFGKGKTYFSTKKYAKEFGGTLMDKHLDFKNTQKYFDIAKRVHSSPNEAIKNILIKGGIQNDRITLNSLLQYMINEKGVNQTDRALVLHHQSGATVRPTGDYQLLNRLVNNKIKGVEADMRSGNITSQNIKFLKDAGATVVVNGKKYGGGPTTALGGLRTAENFVAGTLKGYNDQDFKKLKTFFNKNKSLFKQKGFATPAVLATTAVLGGGALLSSEAEAATTTPSLPDVSTTSTPGMASTITPAAAVGASYVPKVRETFGKVLSKVPEPVKKIGGAIGKRVILPAAVGMSVYDLGTKAQYETPGEFAATIAQQPLDFLGLGFLAEKVKDNLRMRRYATKEELAQLDSPGMMDYYGETPSQSGLDSLKQELLARANRMEFGQAGEFNPYQIDAYQDTGDEPVYRIPEATKRFLKRERGLGSFEDIYGP